MLQDTVPEVRAIEEELCRIPAVSAVRIVDDQIGRPVEVHVLSTLEKHPKQVVRDIQSVAMASFGLDLDRRIISVVQLEGGFGDEHVVDAGAPGRGPSGNRVTIERINVSQHGLRARAEVTLSQGGEVATGGIDGSVASSARHRLVAEATLEALRLLSPVADCVDVEMASVVRIGNRDAALASVVFVVPPFEEAASGSALVRESGPSEAVARAVLDACNRRLPRLA